MSTYKDKFNKKFKQEKGKSNSQNELSKLSGISKKDLQEVFDRGVGAYKTNPSSVRKSVKSEEEWAIARQYAFIMKTYEGIKKNKAKINQDNDLYEKYKKKGLK